MEKQITDYEKMAEEYARVTPFSVAPKSEENADVFAQLYTFYARISALIALLPKENAAKDVLLASEKFARGLQEESATHLLEKPQVAGVPTRVTFTSAVRLSLRESTLALTLTDNKKECADLWERQRTLHLFLLTLTAF